MSFLGEIKRRKVFQVAAVYLVVAWLLIQIVATIEAPLSLPDWVDTLVILLLAIGLPVTLVMSWGFNLTPDGLVKEQGKDAVVQSGGRRIEIVLLGLLIIAVAWLYYRDVPPAETLLDVLPNSIAVLPFDNLSLDPEDAFFAAGIHDSTLNQLAKISGLIVIARTSVMQYEKDAPPIPEIAQVLNVETVMEGSVRYANGRVLITAQLIDGRTGGHLWSDEFNRDLADIFTVQAEVAEQIATAMQVQLLPDEQARIESRPTDSTEAYQLYLQALSLPWRQEYRSAFEDTLERAIEADPEFAEAYAHLAGSYNSGGNIDSAVEYAQKAIQLDPSLGLAYSVLGGIYYDYYARQDEAEAARQRAVELSPNDPYILSNRCYRLADNPDNYAEAIRLCRRAVAIDPTASVVHRRLGFVLMRAGNLAEATEYTKNSIGIDSVTQHEFYLNLATIEYLEGKSGAAMENLDRAVQIMSSSEVYRVDYVAYLYGLVGHPETATELVARFEEIYGAGERRAGRTLGWGILGTRDKERSLRDWTMTVDGYIEDGQPVSPGRISRFRDNWLNDPMLEEPEFLELRRRLGFEG